MFRISLACDGIAPDRGSEVAADVAHEFSERPWHRIVACSWEGGAVVLVGENDFDPAGDALADEFSDAIAANWSGGFAIRILGVSETTGDAA